MGITKTDVFHRETNEMADLFKAIGHPARLSILQFLIQQPACICNDIVKALPLAQPTISKHLSELKKVGIIQGEINGKNVCYCINPSSLKIIKEFINELDHQVGQQNTCC